MIHDKGLTGNDMEVIDEFPAFSFLLGDMHPHVLAYPFVFMVIGLAFNLLLRATEGTPPTTSGEWWLIYLCLGAIGFLNTWDMPFYFFLMVAAYAPEPLPARGRGGHASGQERRTLDHVPTLLERLLAQWGVLKAVGPIGCGRRSIARSSWAWPAWCSICPTGSTAGPRPGPAFCPTCSTSRVWRISF